MQRSQIQFYLNGRPQQISGEKAFLMTSDFLRYEMERVGTKVVCAEGDCGACTCLIYNSLRPEQGFISFNSCITPVFNLDACSVITVEGLGSGMNLHPVQLAMAENHGAQCGFCTPGFICSMVGLVEEVKSQGLEAISEQKARNHLTGNLCRCTGYEPILKAAQSLQPGEISQLGSQSLAEQQRIDLKNWSADTVDIQAANLQFYSPKTLEAAAHFKAQYPQARVVAGSTDLGVLLNKGRITFERILSLNKIAELFETKKIEDQLQVGAKVTLSQLEKALQEGIPELKNMLHIFASPQIKNQGTLVGNILNASPIADTIPAMLALKAQLIVIGESEERGFYQRQVALEEFFLGYKQLNLAPHELVIAIKFEIPKAHEFFRLYKVSLRKDLDISAVTMACRLQVQQGKISQLQFAMGGVGPVVKRFKHFEQRSQGQSADQQNITDLFSKWATELDKEITPISDLRASKEYRLQVAKNLVLKLAREYSVFQGDAL